MENNTIIAEEKEKIVNYLAEKEQMSVPFLSRWTYWYGCEMNGEFTKYSKEIRELTSDRGIQSRLQMYFITGYVLSAINGMLNDSERDWDEMDHGNPFCAVARTLCDYKWTMPEITEKMVLISNNYYEIKNQSRFKADQYLYENMPDIAKMVAKEFEKISQEIKRQL